MAKKLLFTGEVIDCEEAHRIGLVDVVADDPVQAGMKILQKAMRNGPLAVEATKFLVNDGMDMSLQEAISHEAKVFGRMFDTQDQTEGMQAFLEKRKPSFQGR